MHKLAGIQYVEIGGQKRPLRFGPNQAAMFQETRGIELDQVESEIKKITNFFVFRDLVYSALWAAAKFEKLPTDFDNEQVGFWLEEVELEDFAKEFAAAFTATTLPNEKAQAKAVKLSA